MLRDSPLPAADFKLPTGRMRLGGIINSPHSMGRKSTHFSFPGMTHPFWPLQMSSLDNRRFSLPASSTTVCFLTLSSSADILARPHYGKKKARDPMRAPH